MSSSTSMTTTCGSSRWSSTHWAVTREFSRLMLCSLLLWVGTDGCVGRVAGLSVVATWCGASGAWSRQARPPSGELDHRARIRYSSQPRQNLKTAFSRAAVRAKPVATRPTRSAPTRNPARATSPKASPTPWAKRGGAASSSSPGAPSRGRTSVLNNQAYGVRCTPQPAPTANTATCAARSATPTGCGARSRTPARTTEVSAAANCGPRGSIRAAAPTADGRPALSGGHVSPAGC